MALNAARTVILLLTFALFAGASIAYAQEADAELRDTIRAAILLDPRTAELSEKEVDEMTAALAEEASAQGVTPEDITWRPRVIPEAAVPTERPCGAPPGFLCDINRAFGLDGSDLAIPLGLAVTAAFLLFVIGSLLLHRHGHHAIAGAIGTPSAGKSPAPFPPPPPQPPSA